MDSFWKSDHSIEDYLVRLRQCLDKMCPTSDEEWRYFSGNLEYHECKKKEIILPVGNVENYIYFLLKGAVMLMYPRNGTDYVIRFNFPGAFFNSYQSFVTRQPSRLKIEAVNPISMFRINRSAIESFLEGSKNARMVGQRIFEKYHFEKEQREISFLTKSAEENYQDLFQNDPDLQNYIPLKYAASYLGVAPESLSRIRKKLVTRSRIRLSV